MGKKYRLKRYITANLMLPSHDAVNFHPVLIAASLSCGNLSNFPQVTIRERNSFRGERRGDQLSPTEYKGGTLAN